MTLVSGEMTFGRLDRNSTALPSTLPLILSKQGVLTIYTGNPEILPEKSNGSCHGLGFEEMQFLYSFTSVQLIWIKIVAGRSPTKRIYVSHKISTRVVCVNGKHPSKYKVTFKLCCIDQQACW